ncbi:conserved hypothetical protein [Paraburkholderia ribeironis]|uniref:Uncharacterized protein n=1 Tax=Paraburkholderia ribeironis TaxID=1247936 RepID=A0A1N7RKK4_9BURK|nr:conserved hypothetical protein [Paraburkholderia ribeironis]
MELECDRELFQVIALDAHGVPQSRITARHAATLLAEASQRAKATKASVVTANASHCKSPSRKSATAFTADATQHPVAAPH